MSKILALMGDQAAAEAMRQIEPDVASLVSEDLKGWNREAWGNQLGPMMKSLPDLDMVWGEWVATAREIFR